ncbi:MAG TPA: hypothetical protein VGT06_03595 [Candidatus Methylomirabilis sp.]|jgi:hypothetical protein|nr:hypothetical protein [Candidatus Methylomirabilis sp.]
MFPLTVAVALAIPVLALVTALLLADAYLQELGAEMPAGDPDRATCAEERFKEWAREGQLELDPVTGHGRDYDRALAACWGDGSEESEPAPAGEGIHAARPIEP